MLWDLKLCNQCTKITPEESITKSCLSVILLLLRFPRSLVCCSHATLYCIAARYVYTEASFLCQSVNYSAGVNTWWWWLFSTAFKGLFYFWIYCNGEYFQFWRILIKHWGKNMQTQIKKTTCKSESDQIGFFLLEAISLPLPYRITFTFKLAFPNLDSGHYQGGATTLGKITPPRTDSSHRN